ncbi:nif11-like leader peptide domain protein [Synechococcus sp. BIOS-E4-1]|uniref:Nif11-like leader peptide family natural product precursor n=1 Tax=Synechococcus sp. BIOS-E4-1 TaxID=1400864 RepID=UPI0016488AB8|nr:Nif11-like leader peptide family natural product precursor [Synechococcus sp. BIOS-E4-1]QNI54660.1 nif11-like leader peptide domain protein [Synechococcus sp. BIOS-E4-1]
MPEEQLKAFIEKVQGDDSLQEKLKAAANPDAVVAIAKEAGFSISADEVRTKISDEELEGTAAGGSFYGCCTDEHHQTLC